MSKRYQKSATVNIVGIIALIIAFILAVGYLTISVIKNNYNPKYWVKPTTATQPNKPNGGDKPAAQSWGKVFNAAGEELNQISTYAMPVAITFASNLSEELISQLKQADPKIKITASTSLNLNNVNLGWDIYTDTNSKVTEKGYLYIIPIPNDKTTVSLTCPAPFGTQDGFNYLKLRCYDLNNPENFTECRIDYVKRLNAVHNFDFTASDFTDDATFELEAEFSKGTKNFTNPLKLEVRTYINEEMRDSVQGYLKFPVQFKSCVNNFNLQNYRDTGHYVAENQHIWAYGDFIVDFEQFDEAHKTAIYYAWYSAYNSFKGTDAVKTNLLFDFSVSDGLFSYQETEYIEPTARLTGEICADGVKPVLSLNYEKVEL